MSQHDNEYISKFHANAFNKRHICMATSKIGKVFTVIRLKHRNKLGLRVLKTQTLFTTPIVLWACKNCEYHATIVIYNAKIALCATCQFWIPSSPIGKFVTGVADAFRANSLQLFRAYANLVGNRYFSHKLIRGL